MINRNVLSSALSGVLLGALFATSGWAQDEPVSQTLITNVRIFDGVNDTLTLPRQRAD